MPLSMGDKLGHDEILTPLGAGGMDEVYPAHDIKLDREVDIEVLPAALAQDLNSWRASSARRRCWRHSIIRISRTFTGSRNRAASVGW
jgi:hypothetical protein